MGTVNSLIPGLEEYMADGSVEIPNDDDGQTGDGTDISKEVDADGNPLSDEKQEEVRKDPWVAQFGLNPEQQKLLEGFANRLRMGIEEYSTTWKESSGDQPYCPVYAVKKENGGRIFSAYVEGAINDVDDYIDLIDTLLTATENDDYLIYIDSPGGLIAAGGIIASAIHHSKANVMTIARGLCASSAALVHSSAKPGKSIVTPFAVMMYHMSSHFDGGVSTKIAERANNQVRYVNECLLNKALADGHITQDEFDKIQNGEDIFVTAEDFISRTTKSDTSGEGGENE